MYIYAPLECLVPQRPEEDIGFPGTGVTMVLSHHAGAGN